MKRQWYSDQYSANHIHKQTRYVSNPYLSDLSDCQVRGWTAQCPISQFEPEIDKLKPLNCSISTRDNSKTGRARKTGSTRPQQHNTKHSLSVRFVSLGTIGPFCQPQYRRSVCQSRSVCQPQYCRSLSAYY